MPVFSLEEVRELQVQNITDNNFASWPEGAAYGYYGGGFTPPYTNVVNRLDFSNETLSDPGNNLSASRESLIGTQSSSYGYFGGGYRDPPITAYCTIFRLNFSDETITSVPDFSSPSALNTIAETVNSN